LKPLHKNTKVRIANLPDYSYDEKYPALAPGSKGRVIDSWSRSSYSRQEVHYHVRMDDGNVFPFYREELEVD